MQETASWWVTIIHATPRCVRQRDAGPPLSLGELPSTHTPPPRTLVAQRAIALVQRLLAVLVCLEPVEGLVHRLLPLLPGPGMDGTGNGDHDKGVGGEGAAEKASDQLHQQAANTNHDSDME